MDPERQRIINEAARILGEINDMFADFHHWNITHSVPDQIDIDPDGNLLKAQTGLTAFLQREAKSGHFPRP